jgi:glucuronate isomerase
MSAFISDEFLLQTDFARRLYFGYAMKMPIIDYHCHLSPKDIAENRVFTNMTEIWLAGDHYKWRAMRTLGIPEKYITGDASDQEKFDKWAQAVPQTMRNPLYHWTHLELTRYFGFDELLSADSAARAWTHCNDLLKTPLCTTRQLLTRMNVEVICTTDDPVDSLEYHKAIQPENFEILLLPAFRPDKSFAVDDPQTYKTYISKLSAAAGIEITSFDALVEALDKRAQYFHNVGGRLSDHGVEQLYFEKENPVDPNTVFKSVMKGNKPSKAESNAFKYHVLLALGKMYHKRGWTQQFHVGALRNTNARMLRQLGPDTGFDSIGDFSQGSAMSGYFNELDNSNQLAKTVIYNLNPADNEMMAAMIGNYNDGSVKGKMQFGSGWWFLDQKDGMERQINSLSNIGLLSCFIGMLTDSRSFLSFPRHEYFRRILCNLIGNDVENGELPRDEKWLGKLVADVCYHNAKEYFNFSRTNA